jgi:hypothetical protein
MTPSYSPQQLDDDEVKFSDDKNYAFDGKIMFLVLVIIFSLFCVHPHGTLFEEAC